MAGEWPEDSDFGGDSVQDPDPGLLSPDWKGRPGMGGARGGGERAAAALCAFAPSCALRKNFRCAEVPSGNDTCANKVDI